MPYIDKAKRAAHIRAKRHGIYVHPTTEDRFWSKVNRAGPVPPHRPELGPCWVWTAALRGIYPRFRASSAVSIGAHRQSLEWKIGRLLVAGEMACHHCDNPICVRPEHLYVGDRLTNAADMIARGRGRYPGRSRATCTCGVVLTPENRSGRTARCHPCANAHQNAYRALTDSPAKRARANALRRTSRAAH